MLKFKEWDTHFDNIVNLKLHFHNPEKWKRVSWNNNSELQYAKRMFMLVLLDKTGTFLIEFTRNSFIDVI